MSAASTTSLFLSCVCWPIAARNRMPNSNSSSVGRTSRMKACRWGTRAAITSRRRAFGVLAMASTTAGVSWDSCSMIIAPLRA